MSSQLTVPPVLTPMYSPYQKYLYPLTTPLLGIVSLKWIDRHVDVGGHLLAYWQIAMAFGVISNILIFGFYHDLRYKANPRKVDTS